MDADQAADPRAGAPADGSGSAHPAAKTNRPEAKSASVPRLSLPMDAVTESLRKTQFSTRGFEETINNLPAAMNLLGIERERQEAVKSLMKDIWSRILSEEKQRVKVSKVTDTEVVLDQSPMLETASRLAVEAQDGIRAELPRDLADALIGAIDWDHIYAEDQSALSTFRILRDCGRLVAMRTSGLEGSGKTLNDKLYPDDGTPISIGKALGQDRWAGFLGDYKLLPVDETE